MNNAAQYLLDFLKLQKRQQHKRKLRPLLEACNTIDDELQLRAQQGQNISLFQNVTRYVRKILAEAASEDLLTINTYGGGKCEADGPLLDLLGVLSNVIQDRPKLEEDTTAAIRKLLRTLRDTLHADTSLDSALKHYILQSASALEAELNDTEMYGDFNIHEALARLFGWVRCAEATSSDSTTWKGFWEEWCVPLIQGTLVSGPQVAIGIANLAALNS